MGNFLWVTPGQAYSVNSSGSRLVAPLPSADAGFPAKNCAKPGRFVVWAFSGVTDQTLHFDLGGARTIRLAAFLGVSSGVFPTGIFCWYGSAPNPSGGSGTALNGGLPIFTVSNAARDFAYILPNAIAARYWDFLVTFQAFPITLGQVLLADYNDLGIAYSPGAQRTLRRTRTRTPSVMGADVVNETGLPTYDLAAAFGNVDSATASNLVALGAAAPLPIVHPRHGICEVDIVEDVVPEVHAYGPPDLFNVELKMRTLP